MDTGHELILLSGRDLQALLKPKTVIEALQQTCCDLAAGKTIARETPGELVIFDSSGSGIQDVAAAWLAYRTATATGRGTRFDLRGEAA
jgi:ornithine cyclodeaminase/alanine dehydrogenase-like protein (mu-crystallin family)